MALYVYQALKPDGSRINGTMDAASVQEVREKLVRSGLFPTTITRSQQESTSYWGSFTAFFSQPRITTEDIIFFTKQLSVLLKAGVPLLQALELLIEQTDKGLQRVLITLKDAIKEGRSLADGLEQYPKTFDTTYIQLVRAGEASGKLELVLDRLVAYLERGEELRKKVNGALRLPLIQLGIIALVLIVLLTYVIPQMAGVFAAQGATLPWQTRLLLSLSSLLTDHYLAIILSILTIAVLFMWWKSTESGKYLWDSFILKVPIIGYFIRTNAIVQFCSTLGILTESGVNLAESLTIVCNIIDNSILVNALRAARDNIIKQGKITVYLKNTHIFPPIALYLIKTGEESGQLAPMLLTVAQTLERDVRERADGLSDKLGPAMTLIMGAIVGFIVFAIATPIAQLGDVASAGMKTVGLS